MPPFHKLIVVNMSGYAHDSSGSINGEFHGISHSVATALLVPCRGRRVRTDQSHC